MLVSRERVNTYLKEFLSQDDQKHIELITDLSLMGTVILEYGFQCHRDKREENKSKLFELIQKSREARKTAAVPSNMEEYPYEPVFTSEKQPSIEDLALVCDIFYKLTEENRIPDEKLVEWLKEAWDFGVSQQRIYSMEIEGGIYNQCGIVTSFGAGLAMFGERWGLIPG